MTKGLGKGTVKTDNGVGKAADDVFAGIAKGFGDAIGALADNFTKLGEKLAEGQPSRQQVAPAPAPVRDEAILKLTRSVSTMAEAISANAPKNDQIFRGKKG